MPVQEGSGGLLGHVIGSRLCTMGRTALAKMLCPSAWVSGWPVSLRVEIPCPHRGPRHCCPPVCQTEDPVRTVGSRSVGWGRGWERSGELCRWRRREAVEEAVGIVLWSENVCADCGL